MANAVLDGAVIRIERERLVRGSSQTLEGWAADVFGKRSLDFLRESLDHIKEFIPFERDAGQARADIWKNPKVQMMLSQPLGTPVDLNILTREELDALIQTALGSRPDLPSGEEYVRQIREGWGQRLRELYGA